ncbi:uncharacterized protein LOC126909430 [Daktulosphaira vitifoliae]|uniref:uncharacterized protein LOC126909430 n=1 Tax=Daktulosphaira vitifoliae TaxID=58002 RepID=UPI0021A9B2F1|nr:uncharacterized protein LOC126909430 [Daktulosphaira vitifoliae]
MYQLPYYVILKVLLLTTVFADPLYREEMLAPAAANGETEPNTAEGSSVESSNDDEKTLTQQILEGKYGLIHKELFSDGRPPKPGVLSYSINPEVPKDNVNSLGGLVKDEIWLAENHLLVLKGGNFTQTTSVNWPYIDNYIAPPRQVKIPDNPKIPPPFPIQLEDGGPVDFVKVNGSAWRPPYQSQFQPFLPPPPPSNGTFDEDDQSLYYPPKYDFVYHQENSTRVPPGPLVPGIVLPPPPNFFAPLNKPKKINLDTSKTIPRFNEKPYFKMPKVIHNVKILHDNNWIPISMYDAGNYVDNPLQIKNIVTTTDNSVGYYYDDNVENDYNQQQLFPVDPIGGRLEYYYYDGLAGGGGYDNSYDVEKPSKHNKYADLDAQVVSRRPNSRPQTTHDKLTTTKPYYQYEYTAPQYKNPHQPQPKPAITVRVPSSTPSPQHQEKQKNYEILRGVNRPEWSKPKYVEKPVLQPQVEHYSDVVEDYGGYGYQTDRPSYATDNPYHAFFTQDDAGLVDENTKKYFALFGQKVKAEKAAQVTSMSPPKNYNAYKPKQVSLIDDTIVNNKNPRPTINPDAEIIKISTPCSPTKIKLKHQSMTVRPYLSSQPSLLQYDYQQQSLPSTEQVEQVTQLTPLFDDIKINYRYPLPSKNPDAEYVTPLAHISLADDTRVNYQQPLPAINDNSEFVIATIKPYSSESVTQRPEHSTAKPLQFDNYYNREPIKNFQKNTPRPQYTKTNTESVTTQRPYINVLPYNEQQPVVQVISTTPRPYANGVQQIHNLYLENPLNNYRIPQRNRLKEGFQRPYIKFPKTSLVDDVRVNYKFPLPTRNQDAEYFTQRPVSLIGDTQVNYKQPLPAKDPDAEYINVVSTQRPVNRVVSYNLPGNSGSHFFFMSTHTGHPIQYNLNHDNNFQYYKRNVQ